MAAPTLSRPPRLERIAAPARAQWPWVAAIILAAVGIPVAIALATGGMSAAQADDWAFYDAASGLADGDLRLNGWSEMTLIGHLVFAVPFLWVEDSVAAAHWAGAVGAASALMAAWFLFRRLLPSELALFALAVLAATPLFAILTPTYMTDLPSLVPQLVCLVLGLAALDAPPERRRWLLGGALVIGAAGFTIREVTIAAPLAVLAGHAVAARRRGDSIRPLVLAGAAVVAFCFAVFAWRRGLSNPGPDSSELPGIAQARALLAVPFLLGLLLTPALLLGARSVLAELRQGVPRAVALAVGAVGLARLATAGEGAPEALTRSNYMLRTPLSGETQLGTAATAVPDVVWWPLVAVSLVAGAALAGFLTARAIRAFAAVRRSGVSAFEPHVWLLTAFAAIAIGLIVARVATGGAVYDRYLLPLLPVMLVFLLSAARDEAALPRARMRAGAALAVSVLLALVYSTHINSWTGARWDAGERLVASGIPSSEVDAGFEWAGLHHPGPVDPRGRDATAVPPHRAYMGKFFRSGNCGVVSAERRSEPWLRLVGTETYRGPLGIGEHELWLYRNVRACRQ